MSKMSTIYRDKRGLDLFNVPLFLSLLLVFLAFFKSDHLFISGQVTNYSNYFDGNYEVYEPRIIHSLVKESDNFVDIEICYFGYYAPTSIYVQTQNLNGTLISNKIPLSRAIWSQGNKELTIVTAAQTITSKLYTLRDLGISSTASRALVTLSLRFPIAILACWDIDLSVTLKMSRTVNANIFTPLPPLTLPRARICRNCYSYAGVLMAYHGKSIINCGGRTCSCYDGVLTCTGCKRRQAWHTLSTSAKNKYIAAVNWLNTQGNTPLGTYMGTATSRSYLDLVGRHRTTPNIHGACLFLPWHRVYLCEYEHMLQLYDVCVTVPFWYHPIDSTSGVQYHILNDLYLGDEVAPYGILNSPWNVPTLFPSFSRGNTNNNAPLASASTVSALLATTAGDYVSFSNQAAGYTHHGSPHVQVGGLMGDVRYASADPFFYLHHNMVDRNWQLWRNQGNSAAYDPACSTSATISPWNINVQSVLSESGTMGLSTTVYPGAGKLPTGNHCKVCFSPVCSRVILSGSFLSFCLTDLEAVLVKDFPLSDLKKRTADDWRVKLTLQANPKLTQDTLIQAAEKDCNFTMPIIESDKFSFLNPSMIKAEFCDVIKTPIFQGTPLKVQSTLDGADDLTCDGSVKTVEHSLLITEETFKSRFYDQCNNVLP